MEILDLVKFVMCTLVSRVHLTFYMITKGHTVPGNHGTHDKLNQIQNLFRVDSIITDLVAEKMKTQNVNDELDQTFELFVAN